MKDSKDTARTMATRLIQYSSNTTRVRSVFIVALMIMVCSTFVYWCINSEETQKMVVQLIGYPSDAYTQSKEKTLSSRGTTMVTSTFSTIPASSKGKQTPTSSGPITTKTEMPTTSTSPSKMPAQVGCPFQNLDPFDPAIQKYTSKSPPLDCSSGLPVLVYVDNENKLQINWTKVNQTVKNIDYCQYTRVEFSDENDSHLRAFNWSKKFLKTAVQLTNEDEQVFVQCYLNNNVVSQRFESRIFLKPKVEERCEKNYKQNIKKNSPAETMSVLIIGIDGMSKQNLARTMPKTRDYIINNLNARELNKFNKVGDNTFPNVLVLHTGNNEKDISARWSRKKYLDVIEDMFLWHHYQNAGYRTGMGLDVTYITAFHYVKKGWKRPTFDYYNRAMRLAMEKDRPCRKAGSHCVGKIPELVVLQDYVIRTMSLFNNTQTKPYFIYNFYTKLTHGNQNHASRGDEIYFNFFKDMKRKNILNNTIMVFFSDHGARFGSYRTTFNGKVEINTPFVFFMFPPWFEKKYPDIMETFQINQNRLTSFFDIHQTLAELLKFDGKTKKGSLNSRAISLFDEIPIERNCSHASIPMEFCNCKMLSKENVSNEIVTVLSSTLVDAINKRTKQHRNICALLSLQSVKSILTMKTAGQDVPYYQITVETKPGGGVYEALMKYDKGSKTSSLLGDIVRLNMYKGQDACVNVLSLKLYCFCKS